MSAISTEDYRKTAQEAIEDHVLKNALANLQQRFGRGAAEAYLNLPEGPGLRLKARDVRMEAIGNLDAVLVEFAENVRKNGGHVFFARDAGEAVSYCLEVARRRNIKSVVKGKSMLTEEVNLNPSLQEAGIEVTETDLGEYIVQLAGERPSHILAPAIHKTRGDIGKLFAEKIGIPYTDDPTALTIAARKALREKFLSADMGISGCNLACAETGHITTLSNEGNIRMCATMPRVHLAFMGMERIAQRLRDHDMLLRLLTRGASAQEMPTYVSYVGGPAYPWQADGPEEFHVVIVDNGRTKILADEDFREMLCCLRCSACLNMCPVYAQIGGHAYGHTYCGPVGAVVTPLMKGINRAKDLCTGETLCGACRDACPVNIDIPRMLLGLRAKLAQGDPRWGVRRADRKEKVFYSLWSRLVGNRPLYDAFLRAAAAGQRLLPRQAGMITRLPGSMHGWTKSRNIRPVAGQSFNRQWRRTEAKRKG
ncbi:MAG: iron-sulfur cluster-binding protein [bacterium]|nr:iron-sulfur cluster-binding protein [bacterium]